MGFSYVNTYVVPHHNASGTVIGVGLRSHLGNASIDVTMDECADMDDVFDAMRYAKDHSSRDQDFDNKAATCWGSDYSNLPNGNKDALFASLKNGLYNPPPP